MTDKGTIKKVVLFVAKMVGGNLKAQESEVSTIKWLEFDDALKTLTYENAREILKKALKEIYKK